MQVIGVAEPETAAIDPDAEARRIEHENEELIGQRLMNAGRSLALVGVWGVSGFCQRILVRLIAAKRIRKQC